MGLCCGCCRLSVGQRQGGRLDESGVRGQVAVAHHAVRAHMNHLVGLSGERRLS